MIMMANVGFVGVMRPKHFLNFLGSGIGSQLLSLTISDISDIPETPYSIRLSAVGDHFQIPDNYDRGDADNFAPFSSVAEAPLWGARIGGALSGKTTPSGTAPEGPAGCWEKMECLKGFHFTFCGGVA